MTAFFLFLLILLPLNLFVQELNYYHHIKQKVGMATEMACFDSILSFDSEAMSQTVLQINQSIGTPFAAELKDGLPPWLELQNLAIELKNGQGHSYLKVTFEYSYLTQFLFKGHFEKLVRVDLSYEIPIDN